MSMRPRNRARTPGRPSEGIRGSRGRVEWASVSTLSQKEKRMRGKRSHLGMSLAVLGAVRAMVLWAPGAAATDSQRAMHWQFSVPLTFTSGGSWDGEDGTSVSMNDDLGWGFGFGSNLSEHLFLGADFTWLSANYDA